MTNPLPKLQQEARKAFWSLDEQEPQDYDRFLNDLVARTREQTLLEVEAGMPTEEKDDGNSVGGWAFANGYNAARAKIISHLRTLREGITGNEHAK